MQWDVVSGSGHTFACRSARTLCVDGPSTRRETASPVLLIDPLHQIFFAQILLGVALSSIPPSRRGLVVHVCCGTSLSHHVHELRRVDGHAQFPPEGCFQEGLCCLPAVWDTHVNHDRGVSISRCAVLVGHLNIARRVCGTLGIASLFRPDFAPHFA